MLFSDLTFAGLSFFFLSSLLIVLHYTAPSKPFGDVTQALIYHRACRDGGPTDSAQRSANTFCVSTSARHTSRCESDCDSN